MAIPILTEPPSEIRNKLTYKWKVAFSDYPSATWQLDYRFQGVVDKSTVWNTDVSANADNVSFDVVLSSTFTSALTKGNYWLGSKVTSGSEVQEAVPQCRLLVLASMAETSPLPLDYRSDAVIIYDALIAAFKTSATRPEKQYSLQAAGRSFTFHTFAEWQEAIQYWGSVVRAQEQQDLADKGKPPGNRILARF